MSLLTKEQLKEILLIIEEEVNVEWPCSMLEMLHKWNEKQPPQTAREMYQRGPLSIDWTEAPKNTAIAKVALFWVTEDNLMLGRKDLVSIEKPVNGADND